MPSIKRTKHGKSSGNVFADLGVSNPEDLALKAILAIRLIELMDKMGINQTKAAELLGVKQPEISRLRGGYLSHYSVERLLGFFNSLDQRVEIRITPTKSRKNAATVLV